MCPQRSFVCLLSATVHLTGFQTSEPIATRRARSRLPRRKSDSLHGSHRQSPPRSAATGYRSESTNRNKGMSRQPGKGCQALRRAGKTKTPTEDPALTEILLSISARTLITNSGLKRGQFVSSLAKVQTRRHQLRCLPAESQSTSHAHQQSPAENLYEYNEC